MGEKITSAEVVLLKQNAEKERARHAHLMYLIENDPTSIKEELQMEIVSRKRLSEVMLLLEVIADFQEDGKSDNITREAQLFIYNTVQLEKAKEYMINNITLHPDVEKRIFDDDKPIYSDENEMREKYPKFSVVGERYIIQKTLEKCQIAECIRMEFGFLHEYTRTHAFSPEAEETLMDFLFVKGNKCVIDTLENFVLNYICRYNKLAPAALIRLIESGNHKLIMYYITHSENIIDDAGVIDALIARGDKEEVTTYFMRYAQEDEPQQKSS